MIRPVVSPVVRHALIGTTLRTLALAGLPRWAPAVREAKGLVLTLHHVRPHVPAAFSPNAILSITPDFLESMIVGMQAQCWRFVSVDDMAKPGEGDAKRLAITLDDGYRDNFEHAWPVFRRHGVPFTIYVCPGLSDATTEIWWEALERIVAGAEEVSLADAPGTPALPSGTLAEKRGAYAAWVDWMMHEPEEARQRAVMRALCERYGVDLTALASELVMDWGQVRAIAADPLCWIGAHTLTHPVLARLPADEAAREMRDSAERIRAEIGYRPTTIAFPYGSRLAAGRREAALAEQEGFAASFTTRPGYVSTRGSSQGLPRVSVNGLYQSVAMTRVLATPALWRVRDRLLG